MSEADEVPKPDNELTDSNTEMWVVRFYGSASEGKPYSDHVAYVVAESCEEAMEMVRRFHDPNAEFRKLTQCWLLEKA